MWAVLKRDLALAQRRASESLLPLFFFLLALALFPFGVGPSPDILSRIGAGIIWVIALLAVLLTLDRLFQADADDGSLEQLALAACPLELIVLAKLVAHWLVSGLLLSLIAPLLGIMMFVPIDSVWVLAVALLLGTPTLTALGAVGAALLLGSRRGGVLIALLVLPLYIPVLVFGVSAVEGEITGLGGGPQLLILAAMLCAALALTPFATAAALRLHLE
ncbi:MAG: heme exporter protein CcmB [Geminicoccaceae bacterium]